jgi:hypothetical protein
MTRAKRFLQVAASLAFAAGTMNQAHATSFAAICNDLGCKGGDDIIIQDNGAGDTIGSLGAISFATSAFGYSLVVDTVQSAPAIGSASAPQLDLAFTATTDSATPSTIFLFASDTDFLTSGTFDLALGGTNSGASGTATGRAWGGTSDTALQFSGVNLIAAVGPLSGTTFSANAAGPFAAQVDPFSLTIGVAVNRSSPGTTTGDLNLQVAAVPEPENYALMLAGLAASGFVARRRKAA